MMKLKKIDKIRAAELGILFRQGTITLTTCGLTIADMYALSLTVLMNPSYKNERTTAVMVIMLAICYVLNFIPVLLARMHKRVRCGLSDLTSDTSRRLTAVALVFFSIVFAGLVVIRMTSIPVPKTSSDTARYAAESADFYNDDETPQETADTQTAESKIPFSAYALTFVISLEPILTSIANYIINWFVINPFEDEKVKARRALRAVQQRMSDIQAAEHVLSSANEATDRETNRRNFETFLSRLGVQQTQAEILTRETLAEIIHASPDQLDTLLPDDEVQPEAAAEVA